jgi:hypothetical protein
LDQPDDSISIFISYSHRDDEWRQELDTHLSGLRRQGVISVWHDRRIVPGEEWERAIAENLETADVILLLVSSDFIASDYCYKIEMERAVERHEAGEAVVIPVILRSCVWQIAPLKKLQTLPRDTKPIKSATDRDEAFTEVVVGIREAVEKLRLRRAGFGASSGARLRPDRWLLPYLCDRSEQERELAKAVRLHQQERGLRPLVCVIHGDELESHDRYLDRMRDCSLRKFFNLEAKRVFIKDRTLHPPSRALSAQSFWACLGQALLGDSSAAKSEIWQCIVRHEEPMMLVLQLSTIDFARLLKLPTEDFAKRAELLLHSLIEFCVEWPDLPPGRSVILCVSLKYQRFDRPGFFDFKTKKLRRLNQSLRGLMKDPALQSRAKVTVAILPELEAILQSDVERWRSDHDVRDLTDKEIRAWFEKQDCISMDDLADKLKPFIEH